MIDSRDQVSEAGSDLGLFPLYQKSEAQKIQAPILLTELQYT